MPRRFFVQVLALAGLIFSFTVTGQAQTAGPRPLITQAIDESRLVTLAGSTRPEANRQHDLGPVANDFHLDMYLQLKRSPEQDLAAKTFVESLTDKNSPNFHKWITAAEYGQRFGAAPEDIATVSRWLESHGFTINGVPASKMVIDFSGNAGQVRDALHSEIHSLDVAGKRHFANMSNPRIPAALLPAMTGVVSLNDFMPEPMLVPKAQYTVSPNSYPLVPGDLAAIYNLNSTFSGGFTGQGQTIVVVEDTDLYNGTGDWTAFRQTFGLDAYTGGSLKQVHPAPPAGYGSACIDPGINGDDSEAAIDVEWASAAAPNAAIVMASCANTTNFGGFIALQNLLSSGGALPSVVSISYGLPEVENGPAQNYFINMLYQFAAAQGVSVFVSSGDSAAAAADRGGIAAIYGVGVSGFASTAYNVAVGGTDFGDFALGTQSNFWNPTNGAYYNSARSYIPEIPWNDSCGSMVAANYDGYGTTYGAAGFCNAYPEFANTIGGGGGPSGCATGYGIVDFAVSGTCGGYPKPSWQSIPGNPNDGVRDIPDVSLFASNGFWGHYYVVCFSAQASCKGDPSNWAGYGGTSVSSPIMAAIQTLINQALGTTNVGNPNPVYYQIAQNEYGTAAGEADCNSTTGPASTCGFNDVTSGDMVLPCAGAFNCYLDGEAVGVTSTSNTYYAPAYAARAGWDFATGIGSVNAFGLLNAFVDLTPPSGAPAAPVLVSPANAATGVLPEAALTWNASAGATSYDVYFGTASTPPLATNTVNIAYNPGTLSAGTTYYWAVGARNSSGVNVSSAWSFTTGCVSALNPSSAAATAAGGPGTIPVSAATGCAWTAASNVSWITITSGASGSGDGTVGYLVAADTTGQREGTITVAGQTFTVTQAVYPLISTVAGGAMPATAGPGASLSIAVSYGVATDSKGNTYFASPNLSAVFKADPTGVVTRIAGSGAPGYLGDEGPALSAQLNNPAGVAVDASGNVYIADSYNFRVRMVSTNGIITTVAGIGFFGYSGDGGPATAAQIGTSFGLAVDSAGNLYISDVDNCVIREVTPSGIITTVAGNGAIGYSGDGGPATDAELFDPYGVAVDASGNLYIADTYNYRVRMVSTNGTITTVAGNGNYGYWGDNAAATDAGLTYPTGVAVDAAGDLFIADVYNQRIRTVNPAGIIVTLVGTGLPGYAGDGGMPTAAYLSYPEGVAVDAAGDLYIADYGNAAIRKVSAAGTISTFVGGALGDGGLGVFGNLNKPYGAVRDKAGNTYISDTSNNRVRKVSVDGTINTIAGTNIPGWSGDGGAAVKAQLSYPVGLALDASGNLYIADQNNNRVRMISPAGIITTVAGTGICCGTTNDGKPATQAAIGYPNGLAVDSAGNLYFSDVYNNVVRKVATSGIISTVAGNGKRGSSGDGGPAGSARLNYPAGVAADGASNLYIADTNNNRIRMVSTSGTITTVAGIGFYGFSGDGGAATSAQVNYPYGVAADAPGNLYIADTNNNRIRMVSTTGTITTLAGNGYIGYSGDGAAATGAQFANPLSVAIDAAGELTVADYGNNAIRLLSPAGTAPVLSIQSTHAGAFTLGQSGATYTLTITNGAGAAPTSGQVTVTEILPPDLTLVSMAGAGWTCTPLPTCTRSDVLSGGSAYPAITVTVNVSATGPAQATNQASVTGGASATVGRATDLTMIANAGAPLSPVLTSPVNGLAGVLLTAPLTWEASPAATSYDVYFGTGYAPTYVATTTSTTFNMGGPLADTTYYWQIVAKNADGTNSSAIWSFTTAQSRRSRTAQAEPATGVTQP